MRTSARLLFTLAFMLLALYSAQAQEKGAQPAPNGEGFRLKGIDGKFYDTSEMKGDVLVVSFGASWCVPCAWESQAVEELKEEYAGRPVRFLWVSIEETKRVSNNILRHYAKERRMTVPVLRDPGGVALAQYDPTSTRVPVVVFFDREGRARSPVQRGMSQEISVYKQQMRARIDALLSARDTQSAAR
ncbi:MAG TPA: TlpA disulfide reductase family protein [Pyrinomonadaceae bacterium]|nr:TlpA disulfide reductase family protein [Pyrinomonadaceae bacterium]